MTTTSADRDAEVARKAQDEEQRRIAIEHMSRMTR